MPPFDPFNGESPLAVMVRLSNERDMSWRRTKKGDKRPAYDVEAQKASRRKNIKAKQAAALERALARQRKPPVAPGQSIAERMLTAMEPGRWYGMGDLARMIGVDRQARGKVPQVMARRGWVEKARNPLWSDLKLNPWEIMAGAEPHPKTLYRLTEAGLTARRGLEVGPNQVHGINEAAPNNEIEGHTPAQQDSAVVSE